MTTLASLLPLANGDVTMLNTQSEGVRRAIEIEILLQILQTLQGGENVTTLQSLLPLNNPEVWQINNLSQGVQRAIEIELTLQILQFLQNGGVSSGGNVLIGNYNGAEPPAIIPLFTAGLVVDEPANNLWSYNNGTWTAIIA